MRSGLISAGITAWALLFFLPATARSMTLTGFSPASGQPGDVITISGSGFTSATVVEFNTNTPTLADFTNVSDSQLLTVVPEGAASGSLGVFAGSNGVFSASHFLVAPVINAFYPQSGTNPTMVYILGENFVSNGTTVIFSGATNQINATYVAPTEVGAVVPVGAGNGPITVITSAGTNISASNFLASAQPTISSFSPAIAATGTSVNIFGGNFFAPATVKFGSVTAGGASIVATTEITATVPSGAATGPITVTTSKGSCTTGSNFVTGTGPFITDFSPAIGLQNTYVTINGLNLSSATSVTVNGKREEITATTPVQICLTNNPGTGPIKVTTTAGSATSSTDFTNTTAPYVTDFYPVVGPPGTTVTIDGLNFASATSVKFGTVPAKFTATAGTQISAAVPTTSTGSYDIVVTSSAGSYTTSSNFTLTGDAPVITSFTPTNGARGMSVTLTGANFTGATSVKFNGVAASFQTPTSSTQLITTAPGNATTGPIAVANASGSGASAALFYMQPWITALSTNGGIVNSSFIITGRSLTNTASVEVNGISYPFTVAASQIAATIPSNATSGPIQITAPGGTYISTNTFAVLPKIYSFSPNIGPAGTVVTISGTSLFDVTGVEFGGVSTTDFSATTNEVVVVVPTNAASGPLTVLTPYGNSTSSNSFTATKSSLVVLTKTATPDVAEPGSDITYTLLVTNEGPSIITGASVSDNMPAGFITLSITGSAGSWTNRNSVITWNIGYLTNNTSASLEIMGTDTEATALTNNALLDFVEGNLAPQNDHVAIINFFVYESQRTLSITLEGNPPEALVTWPVSPANFRMQINTNPNLNAGWTCPTNAVFVTNSLNSFTNGLTAPQTFFRLAPP